MGVYERLGVRTIVNARGPHTIVGGSLMSEEAANAMAEAARHFVNIVELQGRIGEFIAQVTGAQAGYVTAGAADGILLSTAALMTGKDPARIRQLPDTRGLRNEVIVHRSQRNGYDRMVRAAGATIVEIGDAQQTAPWELEAAIGEGTAGVFYTVHPLFQRGFLPLPEVIRIAHSRGVPVYVDSALMVPPAANLQRWVALGADLVIFSGGKGIRGPQTTGILCGQKELVEAAALNGNPYAGIGRAAKVGKEELAALATALGLFVQRDHAADMARWRRQAQHVVDAVSALALRGAQAAVAYDDEIGLPPEAHLTIHEGVLGMSIQQIMEALERGDPCIYSNGLPPTPRTLVINPHMLQEGEEEIVARRLVEVLVSVRRSSPV